MLKSLEWQENLRLSIKVEEGVYPISQMRKNYLFEVFGVFASDGDWVGVDLNKVAVLLAIFFPQKMLKIFLRAFFQASQLRQMHGLWRSVCYRRYLALQEILGRNS